MLTFICYTKCSTCQKAKAFLDKAGAEYTVRDIKTCNPTYDELKSWFTIGKFPIKKFFNTSGQLYKSLGLKDKLPTMSEEECLKLLSTDGMLVKRPLLVDGGAVRIGFDKSEWELVLDGADSVLGLVTIDVKGNDIHFPLEWGLRSNFEMGFVQITLVDDRIVIHKPTAAGVTYTKPCKVGDNSYIRSIGLFSVKVPKQLLEALGIREGCKADLTREDNCISIRRHPGKPETPEPEQPEPPEPIMAFCCVCGKLLYTSDLIKLLSKFICRDCVEIIKAL